MNKNVVTMFRPLMVVLLTVALVIPQLIVISQAVSGEETCLFDNDLMASLAKAEEMKENDKKVTFTVSKDNQDVEYSLACTTSTASDGEWSIIDAKAKIGDGWGRVNAIAADSSGNLYIGGSFSHVDGIEVNSIAKWDGVQWSALNSGSGTGVELITTGVLTRYQGTVNTIKVDASDNLYVGGSFIYAGGMPCFGIAKWDGNNWIDVGGGVQGSQSSGYGGYPFEYNSATVNDIAIAANGDIYAGGTFINVGGGEIEARKIAKWDGTMWHALGEGFGSSTGTMALALDSSGHLYAGGDFRGFGDFGNRLAKWDGISWCPHGDIIGTVYTILIDSADNIYIGGDFLGVRKLDGAWSWLGGSSWTDKVRDLVLDDYGNLYAGGGFTAAGGTPANYVAKWDGSTWQSLGSGAENTVYALYIDTANNLYRGGVFNNLNQEEAKGLAEWMIAGDTAKYTVSVSNNPLEGGTVTGGGIFEADASVTVTATPASGYRFVNWTENGAEVSTDNNYTFVPGSNINLVANFEAIESTDETKTLVELSTGSIVCDPNSLWEHKTGLGYTGSGDSKPIEWLVVTKNHPGYPENSVTLLSNEVIAIYAFDDSTDRGHEYGSNHWGNSGSTDAGSGIRKFLNGNSYSGNDNNSYSATLYDSFSNEFKSDILTTLVSNKVWDTGSTYYTEDKIFLPSMTELGMFGDGYIHEIGSDWGYFCDNDSRRAVGVSHVYQTRTPDYYNSVDVLDITSSGYFISNGATSYGGVRPALNLSSDTKVKSVGGGIWEIVDYTGSIEDVTDMTPPTGPHIVSGNKIWTITFSQALAHNSINSETFKVLKSNGEEVNTGRGYFDIDPDNRKMQIQPSGSGYEPGEYALRIDGVSSENGKELAKPVIMRFIVE
jgi:hypothetical protein